MKLTTQRGELDLPRDFSLNIECNNPLLSQEGDASIPVALPSSSHNLTVLGHVERIDRCECYDNKVEAFLQVGPVQKRGQLIIDTAHRRDGIAVSFAIDNGDLYSKSKGKTLKEILSEHTETFASLEEAMKEMQECYEGANFDYKIFPVAVAPYEENGNIVYQYNNEDSSGTLVYEARTVHEGDVEQMQVPAGYGIAPFLKLSRLVEILFQRLGFEVTENCLSQFPFQRMVIVHNCSDCLCNPTTTLYYKDLVPSCTLNEFLEWLNAKFHVQPVVDSELKKVSIVSMEQRLVMSPDIDISGKVEGDFTVLLNPTSRVVLSPINKIEGTDPAAATFDKLIEKYGGYVCVDESQFWTLGTNTPAVESCLVLRQATGQFYMLEYDMNEHQVVTLIGTNHFTYDRANSEETEEYNQGDSIPLMLCRGKRETCPFIGERLHAHTSHNGSTADETQDIMVVQAETGTFAYMTTGTTQSVIPYRQPQNGVQFFELGIGTTPYALYQCCWSRYNNLLLNHAVHLQGRVRYSIGQFLGIDMTRLKLCNGQRLLPVMASANIGSRYDIADSEFIIAKTFTDGITDSDIAPSTSSNLKWQITDNSAAVAQQLWETIEAGFIPSSEVGVEDDYLVYGGFAVQYTGENLNPGIPAYNGETKQFTRNAIITIFVNEIVNYSPGYTPNHFEYEWTEEFANQSVVFTFVAVPV